MVPADHAHHGCEGKLEREGIQKDLLAVGLGNLVENQNLVPEPWSGGNHQVDGIGRKGFLRLAKLFVSIQAGLVLAAPSLGILANPLQIPL